MLDAINCFIVSAWALQCRHNAQIGKKQGKKVWWGNLALWMLDCLCAFNNQQSAQRKNKPFPSWAISGFFVISSHWHDLCCCSKCLRIMHCAECMCGCRTFLSEWCLWNAIFSIFEPFCYWFSYYYRGTTGNTKCYCDSRVRKETNQRAGFTPTVPWQVSRRDGAWLLFLFCWFRDKYQMIISFRLQELSIWVGCSAPA